MLKMPDRLAGDGPVSIERTDDDRIVLGCDGSTISVSEFNAWRLFGMMALMLEIPLPSKVGKAIKL